MTMKVSVHCQTNSARAEDLKRISVLEPCVHIIDIISQEYICYAYQAVMLFFVY